MSRRRRKPKKPGKSNRGGKRPGAGRPPAPITADPLLAPPPERPVEPPTNLTDSVMRDEENPSKETLAMVRRAILEGWPIDPRIRQMVVNQAAIIAATATKERDRTSAMKVLVAADAQNLKRADLAIKLDNHENPHDARDIGTNINVNITMEAAQQQAELAAIAAEIRTGRVVDAREFHPTAERIDHSTDGGAGEVGSQGSDGNG